MSTIVPRLFPNEETARAAAQALRKVRFNASEILLVSSSSGQGAAAIAQVIEGAGVLARHAAIYAGHVAAGAVLLVASCRPLFTNKATFHLRRFQPIDVGIADPDYFEESEPTGLPKIIRGEPSTRLVDAEPEGVLMSSDWLLTRALGLPTVAGTTKQVTNLKTDMQPFSKLLTHMEPWARITAGSPSLPLPTILRDEE